MSVIRIMTGSGGVVVIPNISRVTATKLATDLQKGWDGNAKSVTLNVAVKPTWWRRWFFGARAQYHEVRRAIAISVIV